MRRLLRRFAPSFLLMLSVAPNFAAGDWESSVSPRTPGSFPELPPLQATYRFGWNGVTAATGEVRFKKLGADRVQVDWNNHTVGMVRTLWPSDVEYTATAHEKTLRPIQAKQTEIARSKTIVTALSFDDNGVAGVRTDTSQSAPKTRRFDFPGVLDLHSSLLFIRSHPLQDGSVYRIVVYPETTGYIATVTVLGHEKISVPAGEFNAIKLDLQLKKIGKKRELEPHKKFRRAVVWLSDDANRMLVRAEAQIFVGTVFAELQTIHVDEGNAKLAAPPRG